MDFFYLQRDRLKNAKLEDLKYYRMSDKEKEAFADKHADEILDSVIRPQLTKWRKSLPRKKQEDLRKDPKLVKLVFEEAVTSFIEAEKAEEVARLQRVSDEWQKFHEPYR